MIVDHQCFRGVRLSSSRPRLKFLADWSRKSEQKMISFGHKNWVKDKLLISARVGQFGKSFLCANRESDSVQKRCAIYDRAEAVHKE